MMINKQEFEVQGACMRISRSRKTHTHIKHTVYKVRRGNKTTVCYDRNNQRR